MTDRHGMICQWACLQVNPPSFVLLTSATMRRPSCQRQTYTTMLHARYPTVNSTKMMVVNQQGYTWTRTWCHPVAEITYSLFHVWWSLIDSSLPSQICKSCPFTLLVGCVFLLDTFTPESASRTHFVDKIHGVLPAYRER